MKKSLFQVNDLAGVVGFHCGKTDFQAVYRVVDVIVQVSG